MAQLKQIKRLTLHVFRMLTEDITIPLRSLDHIPILLIRPSEIIRQISLQYLGILSRLIRKSFQSILVFPLGTIDIALQQKQ